jgi:hypothetical protein
MKASLIAAVGAALVSRDGAKAQYAPCGGNYSCPNNNTCCERSDGSYGCASTEASEHGPAVCCAGGTLACPINYVCTTSTASSQTVCVSPAGPQPDPYLSAEWPYPMGMAGWQPVYHTCAAFSGAPPVHRLDLGVGGLGFL